MKLRQNDVQESPSPSCQVGWSGYANLIGKLDQHAHHKKLQSSVEATENRAGANLQTQGRIAAPVVNNVRTYAADAKASPTEVSSILEQRIRGVQEESGLAETGRVLSVGMEKQKEQRQGINR